MKIILFFVVLTFTHIICIAMDKNYIKYLLLKFFMRFAPTAQEEFYKQIDEIDPNKIRSWYIDEDDKLLFQVKFKVVYLVPILWVLLISIGNFIAFNTILLVIYTALISIFAISYKYVEIYSLQTYKNLTSLKIDRTRFKYQGQAILLHVGSILSFVLIYFAFFNLFLSRNLLFENSFISVIISYFMLVLGTLIQDYFIKLALEIYDEDYSFEEISNSDKKVILYLRSFSIDNTSIYCPSHFGGSFLRYFLLPRIQFPQLLTRILEGTGQGFVVGIGNPHETYQGKRFHGFSKTYVFDDFKGEDKWKKEINKLLDRANLIVSIAGKSEGVSWEINSIKSMNVMEKSIILFSPKDGEEGDISLITNIRRKLDILDEDFPSEFYDAQFIGLHVKNYGPIWYVNYGRSYYSYIFSFLSFTGTIQNDKDFFRS